MSKLAASAARHVEQYLSGRHELRVALSGGVWTSKAASASFIKSPEQASGRHVVASRSPVDPLDGAVRLAETAR